MAAFSSKNSFSELLKEKKIIICCGSGGVGKTTTSASIALRAACQGYKTIVLTIDPAKRLANSLGIEKIDFQEKQIPKAELKKNGIEVKAPLFAMMLDTKNTFDALIRKYASDSVKAEAILENKLYNHLSNMIGGSQEYMAMEKLFEIAQERDYDLIVLDTPPSRHALDFLEAPGKMSAMVGDSIMKWFLKPGLFVSRTSLKILEKPMQRIFKTFDTVAGFEFLKDLSQLLNSVADLLAGFQERAQKVQALLHDPRTTFLLISSPQPIPLQEAEFFYKKIRENKLPFAGFIFNRVQPLPEASNELPASFKKKTRDAYAELKKMFKNLHDRDEDELGRFAKEMDLNQLSVILKTVPQLDHDVHDLAGLRELGDQLFA